MPSQPRIRPIDNPKKTQLLVLRVPKDWIEEIDAYAQALQSTRSEITRAALVFGIPRIRKAASNQCEPSQPTNKKNEENEP